MPKVLNILTMNYRWLQDVGKRKDVFQYLRNKNTSILCLQDTHFSEKDYKFAQALWGAGLASAPGRTNTRGVSILFNNNFEYTILSTVIS